VARGLDLGKGCPFAAHLEEVGDEGLWKATGWDLDSIAAARSDSK
jgi:hypothetical protein